MTQVAATLIPPTPCRYLSHSLSPNHALGLFFGLNWNVIQFTVLKPCLSIMEIETAVPPHPPNTLNAVSATLSPDMPSAGAFFMAHHTATGCPALIPPSHEKQGRHSPSRWLPKPLLAMLRAMKNFNDYLLIDTARSLVEFCSRLQDVTWLAVDTEFLRESTYYPKLCLMQIATPQEVVACIDTIAIGDISPLVDFLYDPKITKVMHAARQDLEIFHHLRETPPRPVFDSQLAAPLLGHPEQMGYAALVEALLGVHLSKAHTRTDWSHRPLSEAQLRYAADDVRYLAQLYPLLRDKLEQLGRLDWLADDFEALSDPGQYERPPEQAWLRIKGAQHLHGHRLAVLQALAAWRERTARSEDRPRNWLLRDDNLIDLAKIQPGDKTGLSRIRGVNAQILQKHGEVLLKLIEESKGVEPAPLPAKHVHIRPGAGQEAVVELLLTVASLLGEQNLINPSLITNRKELERMIQGDHKVNVLQGWRRKLAGEALLATLRGEYGLRVIDGKVHLDKTA